MVGKEFGIISRAMMASNEQQPQPYIDSLADIPVQSSGNPNGPHQEGSNLVVLMPGAFHTGETFHALRKELEKRGQETMAITFEHSNTAATAESDADQVAEEIGDRQGVVFVAWSRAVEALVRLPERLETGQLAGAVAYGTGGPKDYQLDLEIATGASIARYKPGYDEKIVKNGDLYEINEEDARYYFYHDLSTDAADKAVSTLVPQRENVSDRPLKPWDDSTPTLLLLGRSDRVLDVFRARAVGRKFFSVGIEMMDGGHTLHLSHPRELGKRILQFIKDEIAVPHE